MIEERERISLKELIGRKQVFAPDIWDCFSARIAEIMGFEATMFSGGAFNAFAAGYPDIGLITQDDLVRATEYVCDYSPLPCIIDADDGYGESPLTTYRLAKRLARAGAAAFSIEDSTGFRGYNRWCDGFESGQADGTVQHQVVSRDLWLAKIKAALDACAGTDCMVIARTETKLCVSFDEAIERVLRAHELGADITLIMGLATLEEAQYVAKHVPGNKIFPDIASRNGVPYCSLDDLDKLGFNIVTCHYLEKGAMAGMLDFSRHVKEDGSTVYCDQYDLRLPRELAKLKFSTGPTEEPWLIKESEFMKV